MKMKINGTCRGSICTILGSYILASPADFFAGAEEREPGIEIGLGLSGLFVLSVKILLRCFSIVRSSSPVTSNALSNLRLRLPN